MICESAPARVMISMKFNFKVEDLGRWTALSLYYILRLPFAPVPPAGQARPSSAQIQHNL
jgi:hypothetical protein